MQLEIGDMKNFKSPKNWAQGNRKTLKRPKMMSKINLTEKS